MKTLTLLGATVGDWHEAHDYLLEAEALWKLVRRWHPAGRDKDVDEFMAEICGSLDKLCEALKEEQSTVFELENAADERVSRENRKTADETAMLQDTAADEEFIIVDASGKTKAQRAV
ncbi:hypothetical protein N0V94_003168 [Neodidymelliopsis sp. IMI 364377]|nr:hypothetical protein N0V94_003168 [Neodidymelliopsis sp. IMI 364377]